VTTSARTVAATRAALTTAVTATVAGEPLHFRVTGDSAVAIAAVPIDSTSGITMAWPCTGEAFGNVRIPTTAGSYKLERLRVAPRFGAPPDSVTAERMRVETERAAAVSREAHNTSRLWTSPFLAPRSSRITSPFGGGRTFNGAVTSRHMGTDYAGAVGAPVRAANRGVVRIVDAFTLGGNVVYLDHGEGLVTAYLHLSKQLVAVGDTVARGDTIGRVGATGRVTGPHLHFIARYGTITVDPAGLRSLALPR
jgi:murein DD-endopeptidase MepM/ murein hydrolase activator NlpD